MAHLSGYSVRDLLPEEKALEEMYQDMIGNLIICPDHRPEGVLSVPHSSFVSLMIPQLMSSEHLIKLVRDRLNQQLSASHEIGTNIRQELVKLFCIKTAKKRSLDHVDIWAFFDSVLDESFEELETHVVFRGSEANSLLIPTIAKRSPNLKKLKLNFKFDCNQNSPQLMRLMRSLDSLHLLTSLTLYHLEADFDDNPILTLIGKNCPSLTHLRLAKCSPTTKHDILAIILGELVDYLIGPHELFKEQPYRRFKKVDWSEDAALGHLRVPSQFLTPLCFTLRHLELIEYVDHHYYPAIDPMLAAFILRHMPLLEKLESCSGTVKAVHLLHKHTEEPEKSLGSIQMNFEQACRDAIDRYGLALWNPREQTERPSSTFAGTLSLTKLECVNIQEEKIAEMLRAIELACPRLTDVTFSEKMKGDGMTSSRFQNPTLGEKREDASPPSKRPSMDTIHQQLELALSKWPKLESITFYKVSPEYIATILNVFHKDLKHVSFVGCKLINLAELERCTLLQSLLISSTCSLNSYENVPELSSDTFLPNLKSFSCKICLGAVSSLFEEKSTLNRLILKCCHMDVQECIQKKWQSLEIIHLQRCSGLLAMDVVSRLIDELVDLKELFLHCILKYNDPGNLARQIIHHKKPINLKFKFYKDVHCLLDPMRNVAGNIFVPAAWEMTREAEESPPSRSDDSPAHQSIYSTTDYDPYESYDEMYYDSE